MATLEIADLRKRFGTIEVLTGIDITLEKGGFLVLVRRPSIFLFDEPLSNLDAKLRVDMRVEIKRLHQTTGSTIVYVTHDQIEAMTLATKIAVLKNGELQQVGSPGEIYDRPSNTFV